MVEAMSFFFMSYWLIQGDTQDILINGFKEIYDFMVVLKRLYIFEFMGRKADGLFMFANCNGTYFECFLEVFFG